VGVGQVAAKAWTEGASSLSVFDYLALAPVAGKVGGLMNRMCFVVGTPVAVGFATDADLLAAVPTAGDLTEEASKGWSGLLVAAAAVVLAAQQVALQRKQHQQEVAVRVPAAECVPASPMLDESDLLTWWSHSDESAGLLLAAG
jgi:hypothetical protein